MKKIISKFICFFTITVLCFLYFSCPAVPQNWFETGEIENVSIDGTAGLNVEMSGYAPFTFEVYDNRFFEGEPSASTVSYDNEISDVFAVASSVADLGQPYYLRAKSEYGSNWCEYIDDSGSPLMILFTSGTPGSSTNPYLIETKEDLIALSQKDSKYGESYAWEPDKNYLLTNDIDLTGEVWQPIGVNYDAFYGNFNGGGYCISGVESFDYSRSGSKYYVGFFGVSEGKIENLGLKLEDVIISEGQDAGGLVGKMQSSASVENCYVTGIGITGTVDPPINPSNPQDSFGGLVGRCTGSGIIKNCYTDIDVCGSSQLGTGGVVGFIEITSTVRNCYAKGDISYYGTVPPGRIGGVVGYIWSGSCIVDGCVALNDRVVNKPGYTAGINRYFGGSVSLLVGSPDTYYNKNIYCPDGISLFVGSSYSIPINPYTMNQNTAPFNNWDFVNIWKWDDATNRPVLRKVRR